MVTARQIHIEPARHIHRAAWQSATARKMRRFPICQNGSNKKIHETQIFCTLRHDGCLFIARRPNRSRAPELFEIAAPPRQSIV